MLHCIGTVWARRSCRERERQREGKTFQAEKKKKHYLLFLSVGWCLVFFFGFGFGLVLFLVLFLKKSAAGRYWSNASVSLVSTAMHLFISTAEPNSSAVVLTGIYCFMDHIGSSKDQQSSCYLTLCELSHPRQITHLWTELASHLSLFKWTVFPQVQILDFCFLAHFWKYVWHAMYYWCVVFSLSYFSIFQRGLYLLHTGTCETAKQ